MISDMHALVPRAVLVALQPRRQRAAMRPSRVRFPAGVRRARLRVLRAREEVAVELG